MQSFFIRRKLAKILVFGILLSIVVLLGGCAARKVHTVKVESEANQIIDVLGENGIRARKTETGEGERKTFDILIDGDQSELDAAIQIMEDHCLGQPEPAQIEGGAITTSLEVERARDQQRTKKNIEAQLRQLPGATCVNVNFVPPQDRSLAINPYPASASVVVNYKTPTFPVTNEQIAQLVARSVPDLKQENVTVILTPKPLRPLPENKTSYNIARVGLVAGIGIATLAAFFSIVYIMQKKRRQKLEAEYAQQFEEETEERNAALLKDGYEFDEDDENDGVNLP